VQRQPHCQEGLGFKTDPEIFLAACFSADSWGERIRVTKWVLHPLLFTLILLSPCLGFTALSWHRNHCYPVISPTFSTYMHGPNSSAIPVFLFLRIHSGCWAFSACRAGENARKLNVPSSCPQARADGSGWISTPAPSRPR
jgi:hypothetical protein